MIIYKPGQNIFESTSFYIVNPVNTKGVMGKGLDLEFKNRFPKNFDEYKAFCNESVRKGGDLYWFEPNAKDILEGYRPIINFFTKEDWKKPSRIEWIEKGLTNILEQMDSYFINGNYPVPLIAFPLLGCGEGKLDKKEVIKLIDQTFKDCKFDVEVYV